MFSKIFRMLFKNDGKGPTLHNEIIPWNEGDTPVISAKNMRVESNTSSASLDFKTVNPNGPQSAVFSHITSMGEDEVQQDNALLIEGMGMLLISSGEAARSIRKVLVKGTIDKPENWGTLTDPAGAYKDQSEIAVLASDNQLYFVSGCQTIADSYMMRLDMKGQLLPGVTGEQTLGASSLRWQGFFTNINIIGDIIINRPAGSRKALFKLDWANTTAFSITTTPTSPSYDGWLVGSGWRSSAYHEVYINGILLSTGDSSRDSISVPVTTTDKIYSNASMNGNKFSLVPYAN